MILRHSFITSVLALWDIKKIGWGWFKMLIISTNYLQKRENRKNKRGFKNEEKTGINAIEKEMGW